MESSWVCCFWLCPFLVRIGSWTNPGQRGGQRRLSVQKARKNKSLRTQALSQRRGRDSNPRYGCPYTGFRDRPIQPLWHLSGSPSLFYARLGRLTTRPSVVATDMQPPAPDG